MTDTMVDKAVVDQRMSLYSILTCSQLQSMNVNMNLELFPTSQISGDHTHLHILRSQFILEGPSLCIYVPGSVCCVFGQPEVHHSGTGSDWRECGGLQWSDSWMSTVYEYSL